MVRNVRLMLQFGSDLRNMKVYKVGVIGIDFHQFFRS